METPENGIDRSERVTISEAEFCKRAGISQSLAWNLRKKKLLPHHQFGRRVLYSWPEHYNTLLERTEKNATDKNRKQRAA